MEDFDENKVVILPSLLVSTANWSVPVMATEEDILDRDRKDPAEHHDVADPLRCCSDHPEMMQWVSKELRRPSSKLWLCSRRNS